MKHPALWLIGYYEISVPVESSARVVELSAALGIDYSDGGVTADGAYRLFLVSARKIPRFLRVCAREGIAAAILSRRGAPILFLRLLMRPGIALGVLLCHACRSVTARDMENRGGRQRHSRVC